MTAHLRNLCISAASGAALALAASSAAASSDPLIGLLPPGDAGLGFSLRLEPSPYRGADKSSDLLPLFVYDSEHFYIQSYRAGLKLERDGWRSELFVARRFEGFASNHVPQSMTGMDKRAVGGDLGIATQHRWGNGTAYAELLTDASDSSEGTELRLGYRYEAWWNGRLRWRPYATVSFRDAKLNNYYYGVRPAEATAERPAYDPGSGVNLEFGVQAAYRLSEHWQLLGGVSLLQMSSGIRNSPVVEDRTLVPSVSLGLMYGFTPQAAPMGERKPLIFKMYYGGSTDCDLLPIMTLRCGGTHTQDGTSVAAFEIGQTLVKGLNGWPVDLAGFVGALRHLEDNQQDDFWQAQAYFKAYYYGFPWRETLRTRLGFGIGVAYANHIPFQELRDQELRGRDTSKLLLYLDPSVDLNLGDLVRVKSLRETYVGLGVSHRSGVFGSAKLFNNVDGGSNYIYAYLEWTM
jgi:outer membrane protein